MLCGFETDVCVTHSAVGLAEAGYRVVVAADAVYSPAGAQAFGLARLRDLGVELVHCKGIYYDWVRQRVTRRRSTLRRASIPDLAVRRPGAYVDLSRRRSRRRTCARSTGPQRVLGATAIRTRPV